MCHIKWKYEEHMQENFLHVKNRYMHYFLHLTLILFPLETVENEFVARISSNYPLFRISGLEEGYRLTVGGSAGDYVFTNSNGLYFSTYDHDNYYNSDCVTRFQAGWWYYDWDACTYANLNGPHEPSAGFRGNSGRGRESYTNTEMKIRSKTCGLSG